MPSSFAKTRASKTPTSSSPTTKAKPGAPPAKLPASLTGDRHTGQYGPDGRLFISFRDRSPKTWTSPTAGDWVGWVGTYQDIVDGKEGQYRVRLKDNTKGADTAYPGVEILPDNTFVTTTYGHWDEGEEPYIRTVRFKLSDLDALAAKAYPPTTAVFQTNTTTGYRIPSLVTAKNGDLLAICERRVGLHDHAQNDIVLRRSTDNGATWEKLQVLADDGGDSLNDPSAVVLDNGDVLVLYHRFPQGVHTINSGHTVMAEPGYGGPKNTRSYLLRSSDNGKTWGKRREITRQVRRDPAIFVGSPGRGIQLSRGPKAGRILFPLYEVFRRGEKDRLWGNAAAYSDDGGQTWKVSEAIPRGFEPGFGNEAQAAELPNGDLLMSSRNQGGKPFRRFSTSTDSGLTWSAHTAQEDLVTPACMSSILPIGDILLHSLPNTKKGRENGTILLSRDGGKTWPLSRVLDPGGFAYSCLTLLTDGTIGCLYETRRYKQTLFARFPLDWVQGTQ